MERSQFIVHSLNECRRSYSDQVNGERADQQEDGKGVQTEEAGETGEEDEADCRGEEEDARFA